MVFLFRICGSRNRKYESQISGVPTFCQPSPLPFFPSSPPAKPKTTVIQMSKFLPPTHHGQRGATLGSRPLPFIPQICVSKIAKSETQIFCMVKLGSIRNPCQEFTSPLKGRSSVRGMGTLGFREIRRWFIPKSRSSRAGKYRGARWTAK